MLLRIVLALLLCGVCLTKRTLDVKVAFRPESCSIKSKKGDRVTVHYTGKLLNGQEFDSSRRAGRQPIEFVLGASQVIPGWEEGLLDMCVGERRQLSIPPNLAYGSRGHPPVIPPDATLDFETELVTLNAGSTGGGAGASVAGFDLRSLQRLLSFLSLPAAVLVIGYFLIKRYRESEAASGGHRAKRFRGTNGHKRSRK